MGVRWFCGLGFGVWGILGFVGLGFCGSVFFLVVEGWAHIRGFGFRGWWFTGLGF